MAKIHFLAGALCLLYYAVILARAGNSADFAWIWLAAGIFFGSMGAVWQKKLFPGWLRWGLDGAVLLGLVFFALVCARVVGGMFREGSPNLKYVLVLGAQVKGERPSLALEKRLEKAYEYARSNPETVLILSGGQGTGEDISEAACMKAWLSERGIKEERMILEDKSASTRENLIFSDQRTGCAGENVGIISNNFHIYRALRLAEAWGYEQAEGIAASSDPIMQPHYVVREVFALVKECISGNI